MTNSIDTGNGDASGHRIGLPGSASGEPASPLDDTPTLARNVVHFVRVLRGAGLPMSPAQAVDALAALHWIDLGRRDDVRAALAASLVSAPDERDLFNAAFDLFWRDPDWEGKLRALLLPKVRDGAAAAQTQQPSRRCAGRARADITAWQSAAGNRATRTACARHLQRGRAAYVTAISTRFPPMNGARCVI